MKEFFCIACNGLDEQLFGNPLSQLADWLNERTPDGVHFNVVGGIDPRPFQKSFLHSLAIAHNAGKRIIWIGHSLGAMMSFYMADGLHQLGISAPLFISIDPTQWGTNAPGIAPWLLGGAQSGHYYVPPNIDTWINIVQPVYPGGGHATCAPGNTHTKFVEHPRLEPHVVLPVTPAIQDIILTAVQEAIK